MPLFVVITSSAKEAPEYFSKKIKKLKNAKY